MEYTLRYIRPTRSTSVDLSKLNRVNSVIDKYKTKSQTYRSVESVQEFVQNFVEECDTDYSVNRVGAMESSRTLAEYLTLEVKITLDPFSNNPIPVSICFNPLVNEALARDAKYLESQLY